MRSSVALVYCLLGVAKVTQGVWLPEDEQASEKRRSNHFSRARRLARRQRGLEIQALRGPLREPVYATVLPKSKRNAAKKNALYANVDPSFVKPLYHTLTHTGPNDTDDGDEPLYDTASLDTLDTGDSLDLTDDPLYSSPLKLRRGGRGDPLYASLQLLSPPAPSLDSLPPPTPDRRPSESASEGDSILGESGDESESGSPVKKSRKPFGFFRRIASWFKRRKRTPPAAPVYRDTRWYSTI